MFPYLFFCTESSWLCYYDSEWSVFNTAIISNSFSIQRYMVEQTRRNISPPKLRDILLSIQARLTSSLSLPQKQHAYFPYTYMQAYTLWHHLLSSLLIWPQGDMLYCSFSDTFCSSLANQVSLLAAKWMMPRFHEIWSIANSHSAGYLTMSICSLAYT